MNLLLDTHTLIWFSEGDSKKLSSKARNAIENKGNEKSVSMVTFWEIAIKASLGKLILRRELRELIKFVDEHRFNVLPIKTDHTLNLLDLALHHRDPFDRLLIAQALTENFQIVTKDPAFSLYPIKTIW